ncbi:hypothetical protein FHG66_08540 [Rubellimicrobium rubrum]|uniref:Uncharacterized protein n=1 Tax=Rubellimicrobium rubrum TaxID=2585369 RepID=A0A5C4MWM1_9RHOB|nr:hypothetical protein [Rubellimicrobium rubrum]TNC50529.1 hypothetical protein FHG66_08540 [Rubellimicrobium rubrum]
MPDADLGQQAHGHGQSMERLSLMGRVTGGFAADFAELPTPLVAGPGIVRRRLPDEPLQRVITRALKLAERNATMMQRLLSFVRGQAHRPAPVSPAG